MRTTKAKWKQAPIDQRRVATERSAPKARFTRRRRSGALPPSLPGGGDPRPRRPLLKAGIALLALAVVSAALVIGVGTFIHAEQQYEDLQWRAAYYGRPTLPFSTLMPAAAQPQYVGTLPPSLTTPLPGIINPVLSVSSSDTALTEPDGVSDGTNTLSSYCQKFGVPVSISIFDWDDWSTVSLNNPMVAQLPISWDASASFWRGYQYAQPYAIPADLHDRWRLVLHTADGTERWIYVAQSTATPTMLYAYAFQIITPYTDPQGKHYGYHPCRVFTIPSDNMSVLLSSVGATQSSGSQFPAFAAPSDPRWTSGSATPLSSSFDLRSIPTISNNAPLKTVSQTVACFFITEVDWGAWAQIKLGDVTGWVDTSTVKLGTS